MALTPEEQKELAALQAPGLTAEEQKELDALQGRAPAQETGLLGKVKNGLGALGTALDYAGGIGRTAVAGSAQGYANVIKGLRDMAKGQDFQAIDAVQGKDVMAALQGNAPTSAEYLKRAGVPEGGSLSDIIPGIYSESGDGLPLQKGGVLDPSNRGTQGFIADLATDPLTYLGAPAVRGAVKGVGTAGRWLDKVLHPAEELLKTGGKKYYKSAPAMQAADALNAQFSKGAVSDEFFSQGIRGTGRTLATKGEALANQTGATRDALLKEADQAGAVLDMKQGMAPAQKMVDEIRINQDPNLQPLGNSLEEKIKEYLKLNATPAKTTFKPIPTSILDKEGNPIHFGRGGTDILDQKTPWSGGELLDPNKIPNIGGPEAMRINIEPGTQGKNASTGSGYKSSLYNDTGNATWDSLRRTPKGAKATQALARGLDAETSAAVQRATGRGAEVDALNDRWGKLLTPSRILEREALKGEKKNLFTSVDGMLLPIATATHNPALFALKKAADLMKTNWLPTHIGSRMHAVGSKSGVDELLRRYILNNRSEKE